MTHGRFVGRVLPLAASVVAVTVAVALVAGGFISIAPSGAAAAGLDATTPPPVTHAAPALSTSASTKVVSGSQKPSGSVSSAPDLSKSFGDVVVNGQRVGSVVSNDAVAAAVGLQLAPVAPAVSVPAAPVAREEFTATSDKVTDAQGHVSLKLYDLPHKFP